MGSATESLSELLNKTTIASAKKQLEQHNAHQYWTAPICTNSINWGSLPTQMVKLFIGLIMGIITFSCYNVWRFLVLQKGIYLIFAASCKSYDHVNVAFQKEITSILSVTLHSYTFRVWLNYSYGKKNTLRSGKCLTFRQHRKDRLFRFGRRLCPHRPWTGILCRLA